MRILRIANGVGGGGAKTFPTGTQTTSKTTVVQLAAAGTVAGTLTPTSTTIEVPGRFFYIRAASAPIQIRTPNGTWSTYLPGDSITVEKANAWNRLEVQNANSVPLVAAVFVGWDTFNTNRLILQSSLTPQVSYPTPLVSNLANSGYVDVRDMSGQTITDINGVQWLAVNRIGIVITAINSWLLVGQYQNRDMTPASALIASIVSNPSGLPYTEWLSSAAPSASAPLILPISGNVTVFNYYAKGTVIVYPGMVSEIYSVLQTPLNS